MLWERSHIVENKLKITQKMNLNSMAQWLTRKKELLLFEKERIDTVEYKMHHINGSQIEPNKLEYIPQKVEFSKQMCNLWIIKSGAGRLVVFYPRNIVIKCGFEARSTILKHIRFSSLKTKKLNKNWSKVLWGKILQDFGINSVRRYPLEHFTPNCP